MNAGAYSDLVTIQRLTEKRDKDGFSQTVWEDYYSNYAYVNKLSGSEFWQAAETAAQSTIRFEMRYHTQLECVDTKNYRLVFRGRIFNITNVDNVMFKNETVKISGIEVV
ncbi:phage head closure protein [Butyrivibrio sp.]|uniref:phage head closure protein n=1 Tax=Butyrivibrio sp. TaxID=28121 RepID=UPI001B64F2C6|nr:phage head closure protein [Butyrivibrio sp.]MBP3273626.1 phage head closure protein [Butyrivibrio sp.]MBP3816916.1 phage head closure protein [Butyrivibrio sp.]MBQ9302033.1 phage head closure protein [Butyrivibrio sp.]